MRQLRGVAHAQQAHVEALVLARLWVPNGDGYLVHDYLAMQDSRAKVLAKRQATAERLAKWRAEHAVPTDPDDPM